MVKSRCGHDACQSTDRWPSLGHMSYAATVPMHDAPPKSLLVGYLLWFFLGYLGIHRFYTGRWISGIIWMCTGGLIGVGYIADVVLTYFMVKDPK